MIVSDLGVTLRQNELAKALLGDHSEFTGPARSMIYRWFTEPERRGLHPVEDHEIRARQHVASLRAVHGRPGPDPEADALVAALLAESEEFAALWDRHEVGRRTDGGKALRPPAGRRADARLPEPRLQNLSERLVVFTATAELGRTPSVSRLPALGGRLAGSPPAPRTRRRCSERRP